MADTVCLICGLDRRPSRTEAVCKMCGMHLCHETKIYRGHAFCSDRCQRFFERIENKNGELTKRDIVI